MLELTVQGSGFTPSASAMFVLSDLVLVCLCVHSSGEVDQTNRRGDHRGSAAHRRRRGHRGNVRMSADNRKLTFSSSVLHLLSFDFPLLLLASFTLALLHYFLLIHHLFFYFHHITSFPFYFLFLFSFTSSFLLLLSILFFHLLPLTCFIYITSIPFIHSLFMSPPLCIFYSTLLSVLLLTFYTFAPFHFFINFHHFISCFLQHLFPSFTTSLKLSFICPLSCCSSYFLTSSFFLSTPLLFLFYHLISLTSPLSLRFSTLHFLSFFSFSYISSFPSPILSFYSNFLFSLTLNFLYLCSITFIASLHFLSLPVFFIYFHVCSLSCHTSCFPPLPFRIYFLSLSLLFLRFTSWPFVLTSLSSSPQSHVYGDARSSEDEQ